VNDIDNLLGTVIFLLVVIALLQIERR